MAKIVNIQVTSMVDPIIHEAETTSPSRLHKHAKLHVSLFHSFASQEAFLVQEVVNMALDLVV